MGDSIKGAYALTDTVRNAKGATIDFFILDPKDKPFQKDKKKVEGLFEFFAEKTGTYKFVFSNAGDTKGHKEVVLAIEHPITIEYFDDIIESEDIKSLKEFLL